MKIILLAILTLFLLQSPSLGEGQKKEATFKNEVIAVGYSRVSIMYTTQKEKAKIIALIEKGNKDARPVRN